jgi:Domain of unknown function (DUF4440)
VNVRRLALIVLLACGLAPFAVAQVKCETPCPTPSLSGTPSAGASADPRVAELQALDAELDRAMLEGDRAAVAAILDDGMLSVAGYDDVTPREKLLEQVRPRKSSQQSMISATEVTVNISGDDAVVTSKKTRTYLVNGHSNARHYRDMNTYVRRNGLWKLVLRGPSV